MKQCIYLFLYGALLAGCSQNKKKEIIAPVKKFRPPKPAQIDTAAASIINKTINNYSILDHYFDSGKAIVSFYNNARPFKYALVFKTAYSKPDLFNFEYYQVGRSNSLYVINQTGESIQSWWGVTNALKIHSSLQSPLSAATGVSSSLSYIIPSLLLNFELPSKSNFLSRLTYPVISGKQILNGIECYKITELPGFNLNSVAWIGTSDLMIHKIETDRAVKNFNVKTIYEFYPYQPKNTGKELFTFRPNREVPL